LLEPAAGAPTTGTGVRFHWSRVSGADAYRLRVWSDTIANFNISQVTPNDDFVADVSIPQATLNWSVTSVDVNGIDGGTASSTFISADPAPLLLGPGNGSVLHYPTASVHLRAWWQELGGAGLYLDSDLAGVSGPLPAGIGSDVPRLLPGTYRWTAGGTNWSQYGFGAVAAPTRTLTVDWPNSTPALDLPKDKATVAAGDTVILRWEPVPGAVSYLVELDQGSGFAQQSDLPTTFDVVTGLLVGQTVQWRVRATQTPAGSLSPRLGPWSAVRSFTATAPAALTGLLPAAGATLAGWPVFRWDPLPGASGYSIEFADNALGTNALGRDVITPAMTLAAAASTDTPRAPGPSGTLWWRVRARSYGDGVDSPWTTWRQVTVTAPAGSLVGPVAVTASGPAACASGSTCATLPGRPILHWNAVPGATLYRVFMFSDGMVPGTWATADSAGTAMVAPPLATLKVDPYVAHATWSVDACPSVATCPDAPTGAISHFAMSLPGPTPLLPTDGTAIATEAALLTWGSEADQASADPDVLMPAITRYEVDYTRTAADGSVSKGSATFDGTSLILESPGDGDATTWQVTALAATPFSSEPASRSAPIGYQHTEPSVALTTPTEGATVASAPLLSWSPTGVAGEYVVQLLPASLANTGPWGIAGWSWNTAGATSLQVGDLPPGDYVWRVWQEEGPSTFGHFTVTGTPGVQLTAPAPGVGVAANDVDLSWQPYTSAIRYDVLIGPTPNLTWATRTWVGSSRLPYLAVPIRLPEQQLYWRVCPELVGLGVTDCSAVGGVTIGDSATQLLAVGSGSSATVPGAPLLPTASAGNGQAAVTWAAPVSDGGSAITGYTVKSSPGAKACTTGGTLGCTVTGLANGTAYTFSVTASNAIGTGPASVASNSITPDGTAPTASLSGPGAVTNTSTLSYTITFSEAISGLSATDFGTSGTASGCTVGTPSGAGGSYSVALAGCSDGTVTLTLLTNAVADLAANPGPSSPVLAAVVRVDRTAPTVTAPSAVPSVGAMIGASVPTLVSWTGSDGTGSGVGHYEVWLSTNGGAYVLIASPTTMTSTPSLTASTTTTYRLRVRAIDKAGNASGFAYGSTFHVKLIQQTSSVLAYYGTWYTVSTTSASGGSYRYCTSSGRYVSYTFTGRSIAVVGTKGSGFGSFKVYVDGVYLTTVSEYATSTAWRRILYARTWSTSATHTIKLVNFATSGHPRFDVDAFVVFG
jgi:hypothetical protein